MTVFKKALATLWGIVGASAALGAAPVKVPPFKHVVYLVLENTNYDNTIAQPAFADLAKRGALFTNFHAESHPSLPNYLAMIAGTDFNVQGDQTITVDARQLGDLFDQAGKSWRAYAEDYPGHCFLGETHKRYARKHVPFLSFKDVTSNPSECAKVVGGQEFFTDYKKGQLPDFAMYIPDLDNDAHDTSVAYAAKWFQRTFGPLLNEHSFKDQVLLVVTFDEGYVTDTNSIFTALYGRGVVPGSKITESYDHYSLLRTLEEGFHLPSLGRADAKAKPISGVWQGVMEMSRN